MTYVPGSHGAMNFLKHSSQGYAEFLSPEIMRALQQTRSRFGGSGSSLADTLAYQRNFEEPLQQRVSLLASQALYFGEDQRRYDLAFREDRRQFDLEREDRRRDERNRQWGNVLGAVGTIAGAAIGAFFGAPTVGAAVGGAAGRAVGGGSG